jgi:hypothetical protein
MSKIESGFVSLSEIDKYEDWENHRAVVRLELPSYVDRERIGVNLGSLDSVSRFSGIGGILLHGTTGNETTRSVPNIVGHSASGEAFAGRAATEEKAPQFGVSGETMNTPGFAPLPLREVAYHVDLNLDEIGERVKDRGVREAAPWAKELDRVAKQSIGTLGVHHLVFHTRPYTVGVAAFHNADAQLYAMDSHPIDIIMGRDGPNFDIGESVGAFIIRNFALNMYDLLSTRKIRRQFDLGFRWSFFYGPQFDRALILKTMLKFKKFFKPLDGKQEEKALV